MNGEYISIETLRVIQSLEQENKRLSTELEIEKDISDGMLETIDKAIKYITSYESISTIQGLEDIEANKDLDEKTLNEMVRRYMIVHDKLLKILRGEENGSKK